MKTFWPLWIIVNVSGLSFSIACRFFSLISVFLEISKLSIATATFLLCIRILFLHQFLFLWKIFVSRQNLLHNFGYVNRRLIFVKKLATCCCILFFPFIVFWWAMSILAPGDFWGPQMQVWRNRFMFESVILQVFEVCILEEGNGRTGAAKKGFDWCVCWCHFWCCF